MKYLFLSAQAKSDSLHLIMLPRHWRCNSRERFRSRVHLFATFGTRKSIMELACLLPIRLQGNTSLIRISALASAAYPPSTTQKRPNTPWSSLLRASYGPCWASPTKKLMRCFQWTADSSSTSTSGTKMEKSTVSKRKKERIQLSSGKYSACSTQSTGSSKLIILNSPGF